MSDKHTAGSTAEREKKTEQETLLEEELKAIGHFGTFAGPDGQPRFNEVWRKNKNSILFDLAGVALGLKQVSISYIPTDADDADLLEILRKHDVRFIPITAFQKLSMDDNIAVVFRHDNVRQAVLIALMHWTGRPPRMVAKCNSSYVIGRSFGYPDEDIEAYTALASFLPDSWSKMSQAAKDALWNSPETKKKRAEHHLRFLAEKEAMTRHWEAALKSKSIDNWVKKLTANGEIKLV